jgi:hypothetical protein
MREKSFVIEKPVTSFLYEIDIDLICTVYCLNKPVAKDHNQYH